MQINKIGEGKQCDVKGEPTENTQRAIKSGAF
jgi:hypothetical protein